MQVVKNEQIKNKMVNVFHFQMEVDVHVDSASVTGYFQERLKVEIIKLIILPNNLRWRESRVLRPNNDQEKTKLSRRLRTFLEENFTEDRPTYDGWKVSLLGSDTVIYY